MDTTSLVRDMPANEYHAVQAMSSGGLRRMRQSPAHYYGAMLDPARPVSTPTPAMRNGTLVHCAIFEPDALSQRYVMQPAEVDLRTKAGKEWRAAQTAEIVAPDEMNRAIAQASALRSLPEIARLLSSGYPESSAFWQDSETGVLCKCRPDWVYDTGYGVILLDGKTAKDASPDGFAKSSWNFRYDLQAAWYSDGFERATGQRVLGFVFGAVESEWPHCAATYMLPDDVLDAARREIRRLVRQYADCLQRNHWPGYPAGVTLLTMPRWAQLEIDE